MQKFNSQNVEIAYETAGNPEDKPILLIHGFGSTHKNNWVEPGWTAHLVDAGFYVVMLDNRGHGQSQKLYDRVDYNLDRMAEDGYNLMQHLGFDEFDLLGYSMGARISAFIAIAHPDAVKHVILGGLGHNIIEGTPDVEKIANGLLADSLADVKDEHGRTFRIFADHTGSDRNALAACIMSPRRTMTVAEVQQINQSVLVAIGTVDEVAGSGEELVAMLPNGEYLPIPRRDHMRATGDRVFKEGSVKFLLNNLI